MSPTAPTAPDPVVPILPLRMDYKVSMNPATTTSGLIKVMVTSTEVPRVACDCIIIDVPIGTREGDIFIRAPRIEINTLNWASSGQESAVVPPAADKASKYYRFTIKNQSPNALVPLLPFDLIITGSVNTENMHTNQAKLVVRERSVVAEGKAFPEGVEFREATYPLAKYESFLLYINSFYSTDPLNSAVPKADFVNGEAINLSWESNGHSFELYQGGRKIYEGERSSYEVRTIKRDKDGHALDKEGKVITKKDEKGKEVAISYDDEVLSDRIVVLGKGISADTTFVLRAISSTGASLYETLTLTVPNPQFSPAPVTLRSLLEQVDDATLIIGLELNVEAFLQALIRASDTDIDRKMRESADPRFIDILGYNYVEGMRLQDILWRYFDVRSDGPQRAISLRRALRETKDPALKAAIEQVPDAALRNALKPADTAEVRRAISNNDAPTVKRLVGNSNDPRIRFALRLFDNPATTSTLKQSDDTAHCLRLSDGTPNGNIVLQAPGGDKMSGLAAINFNGYYSNGEQRFNAAKNRWRLGVDQRDYTDRFFIDMYSDNASKPPVFTIGADGNVGIGTNFTVVANGNVGIGTSSPIVPLDVSGQRGFSAEATYSFLNPAGPGSGFRARLNDVSIRASARIVAGEFNATSDSRLKTIIGQSDHESDLELLRRLRITDYTMRDRVQFGDRAFKKIIGQELEEVFPQAVHQHTSFLPDIYARPSQVQRQGEALLIKLPAGLPEAATAGQRLKLIGPAGELLTTLTEAAEAGSQQLLVSGANELADAPNEVFVFGLEHADVRTVDYEAVAMLNVSATQALARQVDELHQQNATLNEQSQAQRAQLDEMQKALHALQQQVAGLLRGVPASV